MKKGILILLTAIAVCSCGTANRARTVPNDTDPEQLVDIGYGHVRKKDVTGSVSQLKVKQGSGYTNIYDYIKGRFAGVEVNGTSIRIRGERSILGSNEPLILVDGLETSDISNISVEQVESVNVLKDASSTAIYGARGANGVIIITTRKSLDAR